MAKEGHMEQVEALTVGLTQMLSSMTRAMDAGAAAGKWLESEVRGNRFTLFKMRRKQGVAVAYKSVDTKQ